MSAFAWLTIYTVVFVLICIGVGFYAFKRSKESEADFYAGRTVIGPLTLLLTNYATLVSAFTFMGQPGMIYSFGIPWMLVIILQCSFVGITIWLWGKRVWVLGQKYDYVTQADYFADRFNSKLTRVLVGLVGFIGLGPHVGTQIAGMGLLWSSVSGGKLPYLVAIIIFLGMVGIYVIMGGLKGVAYNDLIQGSIMLLALIIILILVFINTNIGGLSKLISSVKETRPEFLGFPGGKNFWNYGYYLSWMLLFLGGTSMYPQQFMRYYSGKDLASQRISSWGMCAVGFFTFTIVCILGLIAVVKLPGIKIADQASVELVTKYVPPWLSALFFVGVLAAAVSTVSAILLSVGAILSHDLVVKTFELKLQERQAVNFGRLCMGLFVVVAFLIGWARPTMLVLITGWTMRMMALGYFFPTIAGMHWKRATPQAINAGIIVAFAVAILTQVVWKSPLGLDPVFWGLLFQVIVLVGVSLLTKPMSPDHLKRFFEDLDKDLSARIAAEKAIVRGEAAAVLKP